LKVAELDGRWLFLEDRGGLGQLGRSLVFAFGVNDLRPGDRSHVLLYDV
jgi:hypothetical protein